jgi:hypothetical protein
MPAIAVAAVENCLRLRIGPNASFQAMIPLLDHVATDKPRSATVSTESLREP